MQEIQYTQEKTEFGELFSFFWEKKVFIVLFTLLITICAAIYAYTKTPIYEVKSIIEIGFIEKQLIGEPAILEQKLTGKQLIEEPAILEQKLKVMFSVNDKDINNDPEKGIISSISQSKTAKNFIEIKTEAVSNEIAIAKIKEILEYTQKLYEPKIEQYKTLVNNDIISIENEINFLKNEKLKLLIEKTESIKANLEKYNQEINSLYKANINSNDKISSMIVLFQVANYQNLIENSQNSLKISSLEIEEILKNTIPELQQKKEVMKFKTSEQNLTNTRLVGDYIKSEYPSKPKRSLIIAVAFVTGFILSIFIVFLSSLYLYKKKKNNQN